MQPNVTAGAVFEFHAARCRIGKEPGVNSPFTDTAFDTSGNGNHGTLTSMAGTTASGYAGSGTSADPHRLAFDGTNDYVALDALGAAEDKTFTYEAWVDIPATVTAASGYGTLVDESNTAAEVPSARIQIASATGYARAGMYDTEWRFASGATDLRDGIHHIVGVGDGSYVNLYVDGAYVTKTAVGAGAMGTLGYTTIGATRDSAHTSGYHFSDISLLAARVYDAALTSTQVAANYAAGYLWPDNDPARVQVAPQVDESLWQILVGSDSAGWRDVTDEFGDLTYSTVRPGGTASISGTLPADVLGIAYNEVRADQGVVVRYAGRTVASGVITQRGVSYESGMTTGRWPITVNAVGILARAKRRKDYCHVFVDFDAAQWYTPSGDWTPGISVDRAGALKFAAASGSVFPAASYQALDYHLHSGLSLEQDIYAVSFDWTSLGSMVWAVYEAETADDDASWALLDSGGGSTQATAASVNLPCSASMRGLRLRVGYTGAHTLSSGDEWLRAAELRVYGQSGAATIGTALTGILVGTGLADSFYSKSVG